MLDFNAKPILVALCGCFLSLSACDQSEKSDAPAFRTWGTGQCVGVNQGATFSGSGKSYGPGPLDPPGDPWRNREWFDAFERTSVQSTAAFLAADFERDGGTEACADVCAEADLEWDDGGGCVADGRFSVSEVDHGQPDGLRNATYTYFIEGEYEPGCVCAE